MLRTALFASALALWASLSTAVAQSWPSQPVRIIVPFAAGGGIDILGRFTAEYLSKKLGQQVFIENKPGAGSAIGVDLVAKAKPDGYTLLFASADGISLLPAVKQNLPYTVPQDFSFVAMVTDFTYLVCVNSKLPINTLPELIAYAKANRGKLRYGTAGPGGAPHLASALLGKLAGIEMVHVPFGGTAPALAAVAGGHIDFALASPTASKAHIDAGNMRPVVIADTKRHKLFPSVPTTGEAGLSNFVVSFWIGVMAPAGTPKVVVERLQRELASMLSDPEATERLEKLGNLPNFKAGDDFQQFVLKDLEMWRDTARSENIKID